MAYFFENAIDISISSGSFAEIDLSPYIPAGSSGVAILVRCGETPGGDPHSFAIRKKGSSDNHNDVIAAMAQTCFFIGCDANRVIEGKVQSTYVTFLLLGYFLDEDAVFFDNGIEKTTVPGNWYDILCSEVSTGAVAAFIERSSSGAPWLRKKGSTDELINPSRDHSGLVVGLDENKYCQAYAFPDTSPHFYLVGYLKSGKGLFKTNRPDITNQSLFDQWVTYNLKELDLDCPYDISFEGYISSTGLTYFNLVGYFLGANPAVIIEAYSVFMSAGARKPGSTDEYIAAVYEAYYPIGTTPNAPPGGQPYIKRLGGVKNTRFNQGVW